MNGLLLINKPAGISSFDCIRRLRRTFLDPSENSGRSAHKAFRIGHAGTLDPAASGLMLMLFGGACKKAEQFSKLDKIYLAEITLGATSTTGDREGLITPNIERPTSNVTHSTLDVVRVTLDECIGEITQIPSVYSAIKINGQEAYKRARRGETIVMPSRKVTIYEIRVVNYEYPRLTIEVSCSSGTYIRSLAADIGEKLGTGAYLSNLVRTRVGDYSLEQAVELEDARTEDLIQLPS